MTEIVPNCIMADMSSGYVNGYFSSTGLLGSLVSLSSHKVFSNNGQISSDHGSRIGQNTEDVALIVGALTTNTLALHSEPVPRQVFAKSPTTLLILYLIFTCSCPKIFVNPINIKWG